MAIEDASQLVTFDGNNSSVTAYVIPYAFRAAADLIVTRISAAGTRTVLTPGADFTVTGQNLVTTAAIPADQQLEVDRDTPLTQTVETASPAGAFITAVEQQLDKGTMAAQDIDARRARSEQRALRAPRGETLVELASAASRAGYFLGFDENGQPRLVSADQILGESSGAPDGVGLPAGGALGALLAKASGADHDSTWLTTTELGRALLAAADEDAAQNLLGIAAAASGPSAELRGLTTSMALSSGENTRNILVIADSYNLGAFASFEDVAHPRGAFRTGSATGGGDSGTSQASNMALAPGGTYTAIASGGNLTAAHLQTGVQGPATHVHYYLLPGTGSAQLEYSNNGGGWTPVGAAINTALITTASVGTVALPTSATIRTRITATGGTVNGFIGQSHAGPGFKIINFGISGLEISQFATITEARWKAILTGWGINLVLCTFADAKYVALASGTWAKGAENFSANGPLQQLYNWSREAVADLDWLVVAPHSPAPWFLDPVDGTIDPLYAAAGVGRSVYERTLHSIPEIEAFCRRNQCGYSNPFGMFPDYDAALAAGLFNTLTPAVTAIAHTGDTVSVTAGGGHGLVTGASRRATISGITGYTGPNPNGQWMMTAASPTVLQYTVAGAGGIYGGAPNIVIEDGIHLSALGTKLKAAFVFETTNLRRLFDAWGASRRIGGMQLVGTSQYGGLQAVAAYLFGSVPTLAAFVAKELRVGLDGREDVGTFFRCTAGSTFRTGGFNAGATSESLEFAGDAISPVTAGSGKAGIAARRFRSLNTLGLNIGYRQVTANYTVVEGDCFLHCLGNSLTITLPQTFNGTETAPAGKQLIIRNDGSGTVTVATSLDNTSPTPVLQKINAGTTLSITAGNRANLMSAGSLASGDYSNWVTW